MKKRLVSVVLGLSVCFTTINIGTVAYGSEIVNASEEVTEDSAAEVNEVIPETQGEETAEPEVNQETAGTETTEPETAAPDQSETIPSVTENTEGKTEAVEESDTTEEKKTPYVIKSFSKTATMDKIKITDKIDYSPSNAFIDNMAKVKYNVSVPIDGLPSFITSEMVVGALKCQDETGYPASVTIAQIIQESGFGVYGPGGDEGKGLSYLAYQYNNLFGIKGVGTAGSVNMKTSEEASDGSYYSTNAGFRAYNTYTECINDRAELLSKGYADLTYGVTDANTFAMKIGGRWATGSSYGKNLIKQMETYDLYRLDDMTVTDFNKLVGTFANPCPGSTVTSTFGWRTFDNSFHKGIDLGTGADNIPVYAAEAGTVVTAGWSNSAGNWIVIDHGNGLVTKYMHHAEIFVQEGDYVEKGQQIGISGSTGNSTGNHLHFQVEKNGVAVNPTLYLGL